MRDKIEKTQVFLNLDNLKQALYRRRNKMQEVEHHYNLALHLGEKEWIRVHTPDKYIQEVIKKLLFSQESADPQAVVLVVPASGMKK